MNHVAEIKGRLPQTGPETSLPGQDRTLVYHLEKQAVVEDQGTHEQLIARSGRVFHGRAGRIVYHPPAPSAWRAVRR
jgi:hypothetical protein